MINQITAYHQEEYSVEPTVICSAPGKIDVLGEHEEFCQGYVLSFAIDRRLYVAASMRNDNSLRFFSGNLNERKKSTIAGLKYKREDRWANYSKGIIDTLIHKGFAISGMNLSILSEVPIGIGLSSSSALTVATVCVIRELFGLNMTDAQLIDVARLAETQFMGLYADMRSPMVSLYAPQNCLILTDTNSFKQEYLDFSSCSASFIITDSRVSESMSNVEKQEIEDSYRECLQALDLHSSGQHFRELLPNDLSGTIEGISERSRRVSQHLLLENERIGEFQKNLKDDDLNAMGRVLFRSHESLRDLLETSCPELDWLVKRAIETDGVYGSRMIGSGYGGCTISLMDAAKIRNYEERLEEYDRIFGFKASVFSVGIGKGMQVHHATK